MYLNFGMGVAQDPDVLQPAVQHDFYARSQILEPLEAKKLFIKNLPAELANDNVEKLLKVSPPTLFRNAVNLSPSSAPRARPLGLRSSRIWKVFSNVCASSTECSSARRTFKSKATRRLKL